jgi:protein SCO1/2
MIGASRTVFAALVVATLALAGATSADGQGAALADDSFSLVDHRGRLVSDGDFRGTFLLVAFGYTFCPDVCPTTLQTVALAMDELGEAAEHVQPLFITVDPDRDTPEVLAEYVAAFHPRILGLSGTADQVSQVAAAYSVEYAKLETGDENYLMSHSAYIDLMAPDGSYLTSFPFFSPPAQIAEIIREQIDSLNF